MPIYKRGKKHFAKRFKPYAARKKRTTSAVVSFNDSFARGVGVSGIPLTLRTKLRYHETLAFSSAAGAISSNIFRMNSIFDPNETGVGHQPMYYDQLAALYGRYVVINSWIRVTFQPVTETAATSDWNVGIIGNRDATISTSADTNMEQGHSVWGVVNGRLGGPNQKTLMLAYNVGKNLNLTYKDTDAGAIVGNNPDQTYKGVVWCNDNQATGTTNLIGSIEIIYDVEFSGRNYIAGS